MSVSESLFVVGSETRIAMRELSVADLASVLPIERSAHQIPWPEDILRDSLNKNECIGIEVDGVLSGFSVVMKILDECHLLNLCVAKSAQRQGLGKCLLQALVDRARETRCSFVYLEVRVSNLSAITLYHDAGFNEVGIRPNYYPCLGPGARQQREDALLMTLDLTLDAFA